MFENIQVHVWKNFIFSNIYLFIYLFVYLFIYVNYNNVAYKIHDIMFLSLSLSLDNPEIKCSEMFGCSRDLKHYPAMFLIFMYMYSNKKL